MIKLKSLLNITEQAPQPPMTGAPAPLQTPGAPPTPEEEQPAVPEPQSDETPGTEDPGEYDWTKDFRAFEDAKNKAESVAKKKLLDKMNKQLVGKKVTTNASRGYGQPKTDYTIDNVKKVSVEFWYKEWVVIATDENDKKYFLTPGVNIKIEQGEGGEAAGPDDQAPTEPDAAQTGAAGEEQPNAQAPAVPPQPGMDMGAAGVPPMGGQVPPAPAAPTPDPFAAQQQAQVPPPAVPQPPAEQPAVPAPKKKKKSLAEKVHDVQTVNKDLRLFLLEFMIDGIEDFTPYIKDVKTIIHESKTAAIRKSRIEIPINHFKDSTDLRDIKLAAQEKLFSSGNIDQRFSRGSVDISRVGRVYVMDFVKQMGWKS